MLRIIKWIQTRVSLRYWAWIHAFLAFGIGWGHAIATSYPVNYDGVVDLGLILRMGILTASGSILAVIGLLMTRARTQRTQHKGLWVELVGTILMGGGALQYLSIQVGFLISGAVDRYALTWFVYSLGAFIMVRFAIIIPNLIDTTRQARITSARQTLKDLGGFR